MAIDDWWRLIHIEYASSVVELLTRNFDVRI